MRELKSLRSSLPLHPDAAVFFCHDDCIYLYLSIYIYISIYLSVYLHTYLPTYLSIYLYTLFQGANARAQVPPLWPTTSPRRRRLLPPRRIYLSIYPSIYLSIYQSIYLSIYVSTEEMLRP